MKELWEKKDNWGVKEFIALLFVEFVIVIGVIKFNGHPLYFNWLKNELYAGTLIGLTMAIVILFSIYFIALYPKQLSWKELGLRKFAKQDWKVITLFSILLLMGSTMIAVLTSFIGDSWENSKTESLQQNLSFLPIFIAFVSAAIISPLYEEIFYRGFIYRWLRTRIRFKGAIFISSAIFSIVHIPTYNVMPFAFFGGIIFALAYEKTNSIWPSMIIHGLTNGVMVLLTVSG